jgi:ABC-type antimicrobial peptide transport system permease subunit
MIASVLVGLAAAVIPARRAIRIRIAEGLRRIG